MDNMKLLTPQERGWVKYHLALAATRDWDFETFTQLFMQEIKAIEEVKPVENVDPILPVKTFDEAMDSIRAYNKRVAKQKKAYDEAYCSCNRCNDCLRDRYARERKELLNYCRPMTYADYKRIKARFGHTKNFPQYSERDCFVLITEPAYIPELYGAHSVNLFVPSEFTSMRIPCTFHGNSGHNKLYFSSGTFRV